MSRFCPGEHTPSEAMPCHNDVVEHVRWYSKLTLRPCVFACVCTCDISGIRCTRPSVRSCKIASSSTSRSTERCATWSTSTRLTWSGELAFKFCLQHGIWYCCLHVGVFRLRFVCVFCFCFLYYFFSLLFLPLSGWFKMKCISSVLSYSISCLWWGTKTMIRERYVVVSRCEKNSKILFTVVFHFFLCFEANLARKTARRWIHKNKAKPNRNSPYAVHSKTSTFIFLCVCGRCVSFVRPLSCVCTPLRV